MFFKVKKNEIQVIDLILNLNNIIKYNKNKWIDNKKNKKKIKETRY
jgi:hypothetical protein